LLNGLQDSKPIQNISTLFRRRSISQKFRYCIATGNWTHKTNKRTNKTGVTAPLQVIFESRWLRPAGIAFRLVHIVIDSNDQSLNSYSD
jgi:hypothetical protein